MHKYFNFNTANRFYSTIWKLKKESDYNCNQILLGKKIINFLAQFEKSEEDITCWPSWFCKLFMRPYEITIKARKTATGF